MDDIVRIDSPVFKQILRDPLRMDSEEVRERVRRLPVVEFNRVWNAYLLAKAGLTQTWVEGKHGGISS